MKKVQFKTKETISSDEKVRMTITQNKQLGIGTENPSQTIDVSGSLFVNGSIKKNGSDLYTLSSKELKDLSGVDYQTPSEGQIFLWKDASNVWGAQTIEKTWSTKQDEPGTILTYNVADSNVAIGKTTVQYYLDGSNQVNYKQDVSGNSNISNELHIGEKLGVGNNIVPEYPLHVDGTTFSSTSWSTSDDRVKHNEQSIDGALDTIDKLEPKHYIKTQKMYDASHNFTLNSSGNPVKDNGELLTDYTRETGLIAQEVKDIPELAFAVKDGAPMSVDYNSIHCTHIAATKELNTKIEALKAKNTALEEENTQMEQDLQNIKQHLGI